MELPDLKALEPPGPTGLQQDLPCPRCEYNLRGLTLPRCPECGFEFTWESLPLIFEELRKRRERRGSVIASILIGSVFIGLMLLVPEILLLLGLLLVVLLPFVVSGGQAAVEICIAAPIMGRTSWSRFRSWWEGVLIGYGLSGVTILLAGRCWSPGDYGGNIAERWSLLHFYVGTTIEAAMVQYWVVRRRSHQWKIPVACGRLAAACALSKLVTGTLWFLMPFKLVALR